MGCGFSSEPLTPDQVTVYQAVLKEYAKDQKKAANLYNHTVPLHWSSSFKQACPAAIDPESIKASSLAFHRIPPEVVQTLKFTLVDPDARGLIQVDPRKLVPRVPGGDEVTSKELDDADNHSFENGALWLSEIAFDKSHRKAVVKLSFFRGDRLRKERILLLELKDGQWNWIDTCLERVL